MEDLENEIFEGFTALILLQNFLSDETLREHIRDIQKEIRSNGRN